MNIKDKLSIIYMSLYIHNRALFVGYNTKFGSRMYGTLDKIPLGGCTETPCAENLIVGMGVGMALEGSRLPILCFERHEFALFGMGLLAAFADKFFLVSGVRIPMVVRVIKGGTKPLDPGAQHCTDYQVSIMYGMSNTIYIKQETLTYDILLAALRKSPSGIVVILEDRDGYDKECA